MAFIQNRQNGQNFAENLVDPLLLFNEGTWTIPSGTGSALINTNTYYAGSGSLRVQNNTPASDIVATNSTQSSTVPIDGNYQVSFYVKKDIALEVREGAVLIYQNAVLLDTQTFSIGSVDADDDIDNTWVRFSSDTEYSLTKGDDITFQFRIDASGTAELTTFLFFDAVMLNLNERRNIMSPSYSLPVYNPTLNTSNVVLENLIVDTFGLSALSTAPSSASDTGTLGEIRIDADYIYVCTATDTWKRVAIATW